MYPDLAVQEFGEQNPLLCKQLGDAKQAERQVEEYQGMKAFILSWTKKAEALVTGNIIWSSASQLQEQIRAHQVSFNGAASRDCE
uniref:Uncharacterized protein n=1 Tax=Maylandia zebra TaxID=106582 RepID=A0A3P9CP88_9CICH